MKQGSKELLVVGDRVLIQPEEGETVTKVGLVLPPGAIEREEVRSGVVVAKGPGNALPPLEVEDEPWKSQKGAGRFLPMQVEIGDYALFFRKAAIEISFEEKRYLVVPHGAILVLVRGADVPDRMPPEL